MGKQKCIGIKKRNVLMSDLKNDDGTPWDGEQSLKVIDRGVGA